MFGFMRKLSQGAGTAIAYITIGTLAMIWSGVWYYGLRQHEMPPGTWHYYVCAGTFLSGLALTSIGFLIGRIAQDAKRADTNAVAATPVAPAAIPGTMMPMGVPGVPMMPGQMPTLPAATVLPPNNGPAAPVGAQRRG